MRGTQCSQSDGRDKTLACHLIGKTEPCAQKILSQRGISRFLNASPSSGVPPCWKHQDEFLWRGAGYS